MTVNCIIMAHFVRELVSLRENTMELSNGLVYMLSRWAWYANYISMHLLILFLLHFYTFLSDFQ